MCFQIFQTAAWTLLPDINLHHCSMHPERQRLLKMVLQHPGRKTRAELTTFIHLKHHREMFSLKTLGRNTGIERLAATSNLTHPECRNVTIPLTKCSTTCKTAPWCHSLDSEDDTARLWSVSLESIVAEHTLPQPPGSQSSLRRLVSKPYFCRLILLPRQDFEGQEPRLRCCSLSLRCRAPRHRKNSGLTHSFTSAHMGVVCGFSKTVALIPWQWHQCQSKTKVNKQDGGQE